MNEFSCYFYIIVLLYFFRILLSQALRTCMDLRLTNAVLITFLIPDK